MEENKYQGGGENKSIIELSTARGRGTGKTR